MNEYKLLYLNENAVKFAGFNRADSPFVIIGIPMDITSSYRPGSRFAPYQIRNNSQYIEFYSMRTGIDIGEVGFNDVGDIILHPSNVEENLRRITDVVSYFIEQNKKVISIGGEHTITLGIVRAFKDKPCIISFDAHLDLRDDYLGYKYDHACVMRRIYEEMRPKIVEIGTRAVSREELEFASKNGITYFTPYQIRVLGIRETARKLLLLLQDCKSVYISYDMDVFDPSFAPGVATPEPEGLDPTSVLDLVNILLENIKSKVLGFDVVEVSPPFDPSYTTVILASRIILETSAIILKYLK